MPSSPDTLRVLLVRFAVVMKVTNNTGTVRWWAHLILTWYSRTILDSPTHSPVLFVTFMTMVNAIHQICFKGLEHEDKANLTLPYCRASCNSSEPSSTIWLLYDDQLSLLLSLNKLFCSFHGVIVLFELVKNKFPNSTLLHNVHLYSFQITHRLKQCTMCQPTKYYDTIYHIYPTPPLGQDMTQGQFLSGV